MKILSIIAEYNPLHNGHEYHLRTSREKSGCDGIIVIMSGNFVQRGEIAVADKWVRTLTALHSGADLVIELPVPYALSSAEGFAFGAVSILDSLNIVDELSFSSESGEIGDLSICADSLITDEMVQLTLKKLKNGSSYASARQMALDDIMPNISHLISSPNNILGIEYIKALKKLESKITPITMLRRGPSYNDLYEADGFISASRARQIISENGLPYVKPFIPEKVFDIYLKAYEEGIFPVFEGQIETAVLSVLKRMDKDDFLKIPDVSEGLENRIMNCVNKTSDLNILLNMLKTKRYPMTRLKRILLRAFIGIEKDYSKIPPPYARVLGFNQTGRKILSLAKEKATIPIITKPSTVKKEGPDILELFNIEAVASGLYSLAYPRRDLRLTDNEFKTGPVIL